MDPVIIASAAGFETDSLVAALNSRGICCTQLVTGVGLVQATLMANRLRDLVLDRNIIFCCSAGIFGDFSKVEIFEGASVELSTGNYRSGEAYFLDQFDPIISLQTRLNLPKARILNSLGVSTKVESIDGPFPVLETLELYGVARSWLPVAKSFTAIVATTNSVGPMAHQQWKENFARAANLTASSLISKLGFLDEVN